MNFIIIFNIVDNDDDGLRRILHQGWLSNFLLFWFSLCFVFMILLFSLLHPPRFLILGIFFVLPCIESYQKVDLRTITLDVPPQEVKFQKFGKKSIEWKKELEHETTKILILFFFFIIISNLKNLWMIYLFPSDK